MSDELKQALEQFAMKMLRGGDLVADQLPLVIQDYLRWYTAECVLWMALSGIAILTGFFALRGAARCKGATCEERRRMKGWAWVCHEIDAGINFSVAFLGAVALIPLLVNTWSLVKVLTAPRVVILELVRRLLQ